MNTIHIKTSFYSAYRILKYFPALCESYENCSTYNIPVDSFPPELWNCTLHIHRLVFSQLFKGTTKIYRTLSLHSSLLSRALLLKLRTILAFPNSNLCFLNSVRPHGSIWDHPHCTEIWKLPPGRKLGHHRAHLAFHRSEISVLHCLLFNIWKQLLGYFVQSTSYL